MITINGSRKVALVIGVHSFPLVLFHCILLHIHQVCGSAHSNNRSRIRRLRLPLLQPPPRPLQRLCRVEDSRFPRRLRINSLLSNNSRFSHHHICSIFSNNIRVIRIRYGFCFKNEILVIVEVDSVKDVIFHFSIPDGYAYG